MCANIQMSKNFSRKPCTPVKAQSYSISIHTFTVTTLHTSKHLLPFVFPIFSDVIFKRLLSLFFFVFPTCWTIDSVLPPTVPDGTAEFCHIHKEWVEYKWASGEKMHFSRPLAHQNSSTFVLCKLGYTNTFGRLTAGLPSMTSSGGFRGLSMFVVSSCVSPYFHQTVRVHHTLVTAVSPRPDCQTWWRCASG